MQCLGQLCGGHRSSNSKLNQGSNKSAVRTNKKLKNSAMSDASCDAAVGAWLGACVGDACGAVLEFSPEAAQRSIPAKKIEWAMSLPGGGIWSVGPGQFTDDSELSLCLAHGLITSEPPNLPLDAVACRYMDWVQTGPFDIGMATRAAFGSNQIQDYRQKNGPTDIASKMKTCTAYHNGNTQANGALMRCTPLAIWSHRLSTDKIAECSRSDASLSHPNQICQDANAVYCIAIASLIILPGDAKAAVERAESWAREKAHPTIQDWLKEALSNNPLIKMGVGTDGWVRWGLTLAFRHLHLQSSYRQAIEDTLSRGGDTDTNAAIVGGMIGALHGVNKISEHLRSKVFSRDPAQGNPRPEFLHPGQVPSMAKQLYQMGLQQKDKA